MIIAYRNGSPVRIKDIGKSIEAPENDLLAGWYNKQRAVVLVVQRVPGANVIQTVDTIKKMLPQLQASIPPAIKLSIASDRTLTIRAAVADVQSTLMLTVALVVMVIFVFLRNFWATVIPAVTVPLSLIGTFAVLYELNYSLDRLSLMALSIGVGFVVDDAVVVIENIVRYLRMVSPPWKPRSKARARSDSRLFDHIVADRRVHPVILDGRLCRQAVPGICRYDQRFAAYLACGFADVEPMMCSRLLNMTRGTAGSIFVRTRIDGLLVL